MSASKIGFGRVLLALFLGLALSISVKSQSFEADEIASLESTMTQFRSDMTALNHEGILRVMPPKIWNYLKEKAKLDDAQLLAAVSKALKQTLENVEIVSFSMSAAESKTLQLSDGQKYILVPTETRTRVTAGEIYVVRSQTLALYEDKTWYLIRINDPQQRQILGDVYPFFKNVEFPEEQTEIVKE